MEENRKNNAEVINDEALDEVTGGTQIMGANPLVFRKTAKAPTASSQVANGSHKNLQGQSMVYKQVNGKATDHGSADPAIIKC